MKFYSSPLMKPRNGPIPLQNKVMFDIKFYFVCRGFGNFRTMTINTFKVVHDKEYNTVYIMRNTDEPQKNHQEVNGEIITAYIPELPNDPMCPVVIHRLH